MRLPEHYLELLNVSKEASKTFHLKYSLKRQTKNLRTVFACREGTDIILEPFKQNIHLMTHSLQEKHISGRRTPIEK
jgi:hypothetical protein